MRIRTAIAIAAIGASTLATGCAPAATSSSTTSTTDATDAFVSTMRKRFPDITRAKAVDLGQTACQAITDAGSILDLITAAAMDDSVSVEMAGDMAYTVGASVPVFCPRYLPQLRALQ